MGWPSIFWEQSRQESEPGPNPILLAGSMGCDHPTLWIWQHGPDVITMYLGEGGKVAAKEAAALARQ